MHEVHVIVRTRNIIAAIALSYIVIQSRVTPKASSLPPPHRIPLATPPHLH